MRIKIIFVGLMPQYPGPMRLKCMCQWRGLTYMERLIMWPGALVSYTAYDFITYIDKQNAFKHTNYFGIEYYCEFPIIKPVSFQYVPKQTVPSSNVSHVLFCYSVPCIHYHNIMCACLTLAAKRHRDNIFQIMTSRDCLLHLTNGLRISMMSYLFDGNNISQRAA